MFLKITDKIKNYFLKKKFTNVYINNSFKGTHSKSGEGSGLLQTAVIRQKIPELLERLHITSMIDAPCGDLFWISKVNLPVQKYIGVDIVSEMIQINQEQHGNEQRSFTVINLAEDNLQKADIILCRDCLVHLSYNDTFKILNNFKKSGSKYLLTTTFTVRTCNIDLGKTFWRPLNLELPPFNFPKPLESINENCTEANGTVNDKCLSLWYLNDLKLG